MIAGTDCVFPFPGQSIAAVRAFRSVFSLISTTSESSSVLSLSSKLTLPLSFPFVAVVSDATPRRLEIKTFSRHGIFSTSSKKRLSFLLFLTRVCGQTQKCPHFLRICPSYSMRVCVSAWVCVYDYLYTIYTYTYVYTYIV